MYVFKDETLVRQICFKKRKIGRVVKVILPLLSPVYDAMISHLGYCSSLLSSLYPSCPLEADIPTTENTSEVLLYLCPNFPRASHLTKSETESFYRGCHGIPGLPLRPFCPHLTSSLITPFRTLCSPCFPWVCHTLLRTFPHTYPYYWNIILPDILITHFFASFPSLFK